MTNMKKEKLKTWSEEAIDTLTVFSHMNAYGMLPVVIIKTKTESPEAANGGILEKSCSQKFRKIHRKTPAPESLF